MLVDRYFHCYCEVYALGGNLSAMHWDIFVVGTASVSEDFCFLR